jgi:ATP-dependent RNA helicase HelY
MCMNKTDPEAFCARYGFPLDDFQIESINHLAEDRSVLVVAPTGAGKTVIAEFAVMRSMEEGMKVFYTTPIKALSNQKFRDFSLAFGADRVGLLTGDNSINPDAPIVVMTTEVLRNMIYERSSTLQGLRFAVLDECHYLMDPFRGPVWEEIFIHLPPSVKIVALSATVSNYREFGDWLNALRGDVEVVSTSERPVPLRYYYFIGNTMLGLFSEKAPSIVADYQKAAKGERGEPGRRALRPRNLIPHRHRVVRQLFKSRMLPAIYFIFSRAGCNAAVTHCLEEGLDLTTPEEKRIIEEQALAELARLPEEDLSIFGYRQWLEALKAGVSAHHAGMLPLFKEIVEDLFARGLVKVVFATETLSLGINMPAKTVVIESLFKFNGESHELLTPTEFTQLTGRAGRRGIDPVGNGVVLYHPMVTLAQVQRLARRESLPLTSSFSLSYNMALNLLQSYTLDEAVDIINSSFAQFTADRDVIRLERTRKKHQRVIDQLSGEMSCDKGDAEAYLELRGEISLLEKEAAQERRRKRVELINHELEELAVGDVVVIQRKGERHRALMLSRGTNAQGHPRLHVMDERGRHYHADYHNFNALPQILGHYDGDLSQGLSKRRRREVREWLARFEVPDPEPWEDVEHPHRLREGVKELRAELEKSHCHRCRKKDLCLGVARKALRLRAEMKSLERQMESRSDVVSRKLRHLCRVLERLGFLEGETLTEKGSVLSRLYNECDLLLVEMLWENVLVRLEPEELGAFLSCFVYESRESPAADDRRGRRRGADRGPGRAAAPAAEAPTPGLAQALQEARARLARIKQEEEAEGLDLLRAIDPGFMQVVYDWAQGCELEFIIHSHPNLSAGDFVRSMKQTLDLVRQLSGAAEDPLLLERLQQARRLINRSIVAYTSAVDFIEEELEGGRGNGASGDGAAALAGEG